MGRLGGAGCSRSHELQRAFPIGTAAESALSSNTRSVGHAHMNFSAFPMGTAANSAWSSGFLSVLGCLCSHEPQRAFPIDTLVDKTKTHCFRTPTPQCPARAHRLNISTPAEAHPLERCIRAVALAQAISTFAMPAVLRT